MSEHFIREIEIKNFKCFNDFKADGFGRVNLIGGKNNVGKTAFMEAIFLASDIKSIDSIDFINSFFVIETLREVLKSYSGEMLVLEIIKVFEKYQNIEIKTKDFYIHLEIQKDMLQDKFLINGKDSRVSRKLSNEFFINSYELWNFIPSYIIGNKLIFSIFNQIKKQRKKTQLNNILKQFDNNILEFEIIDNQPQVFLDSSQKFQNILELGHGLKRYIVIIASILINRDGFLFLDEIENGIHHSQLDKLWNIILTISKEQNVQVFATTHSEECIKALVTANKEDVKTYQPKEPILENNEIKFIELGIVDGKVDSIIFDFKELENEVEQNMEIRGW